MSAFLRLFEKDLLLIFRRRGSTLSMFAFALVAVLLASFSFRDIGFGSEQYQQLSPGLLWLVSFFLSTIALNQCFAAETGDRALMGVVLTPVNPSALFFAKATSNFALLTALQVVVLVAESALLNSFSGQALPLILAIIVLAGIGLSALGTLLAAIVSLTHAKDLVLPLFFFPLALPVLAAATELTREAIFEGGISLFEPWLLLLLAYDVLSLTLGAVLFGYVIREI